MEIEAEFAKSSACHSGSCVEVRITDTIVSVRNTDTPEQQADFTHEEWSAFLIGVKSGEFDLRSADRIPVPTP
ncbi:hypothetical protein PSU4_22280 [Pseudonocardia sulfidoxydans NBRC 16205]|uniref:DUF397 domain-containing protein n=1 Tax=Pseudonocardia sulfidoxydans NBRC 16205 TaxID=1223511 RepID=A0A511DHN5_9PSEU|nr:DUF397 domain-containing protein [Pseudonocardia sulfidoxydans]GEL23274.1 hypothetical protein PSU4_22280 [Pseudonocardia sulfidoxydans NBRC 16205]